MLEAAVHGFLRDANLLPSEPPEPAQPFPTDALPPWGWRSRPDADVDAALADAADLDATTNDDRSDDDDDDDDGGPMDLDGASSPPADAQPEDPFQDTILPLPQPPATEAPTVERTPEPVRTRAQSAFERYRFASAVAPPSTPSPPEQR